MTVKNTLSDVHVSVHSLRVLSSRVDIRSSSILYHPIVVTLLSPLGTVIHSLKVFPSKAVPRRQDPGILGFWAWEFQTHCRPPLGARGFSQFVPSKAFRLVPTPRTAQWVAEIPNRRDRCGGGEGICTRGPTTRPGMSRPIAVGEHSHKELDPAVDLMPASLDFLEGGSDRQTDLDRMEVHGTPRSRHSAQCSFQAADRAGRR